MERQAKLMGMTPNAYLRQGLAAMIAGNEEASRLPLQRRAAELGMIARECHRLALNYG